MSAERKLGQKQERVHVYVATPAYDGKVETGYSQSLAESAFTCPLYQVYFSAAVMGNGAFIELSRNLFAKWFLEQTDCTHLFFIDSDLKFEARGFVGLARSGLPICAGAYRRRQKDEDYPIALAEHPTEGGLWVEDGWVMANRVPTGFLCISRTVIEEMSKDAKKVKIQGQGEVPWLFYTKFDPDGQFVGEDFAFCDDYVAKYGKKIPVWPGLDFVHGGYECNYEQFLERKIKGEEARRLKEAA